MSTVRICRQSGPDAEVEVLGRVTVGDDGAAVWDDSISELIESVERGRLAIDPATDGEAFVQALPAVIRSAPYCWAELEGADG